MFVPGGMPNLPEGRKLTSNVLPGPVPELSFLWFRLGFEERSIGFSFNLGLSLRLKSLAVHTLNMRFRELFRDPLEIHGKQE